jgi:hypothetical protein
MTRQTDAPLPEYRLTASNRGAREIARFLAPQTDLNPPYQRGAVWTEDQQIALVKSWVMGVTVPAIILNDRTGRGWRNTEGVDVYQGDNRLWACVDGQQRIRASIAWFMGDLMVPASWFSPENVAYQRDTDDGPYVRYTDLSMPTQRHMGHSAHLPVIECQLPSIKAEAELYLLVNGGGTAQTVADMENAAEVAGR